MADRGSTPALKNIRAVIELERQASGRRTRLDRVSDGVTRLVSSPAFIVVHLVWFTAWIAVNAHRRAFDPFPFSLLTLVVSLEAIVLTGFVLMSQNRLTRQADARAHLDLQINLLAEEELTAILRLLTTLCEKAGIDPSTSDPGLSELQASTDVRTLAIELGQELNGAESPRR